MQPLPQNEKRTEVHMDSSPQADGRSGAPRLLTLKQAAHRLDVHPAALRLAIVRGALTPDHITRAGQPRFFAPTLDAYASQRKRASLVLAPHMRAKLAQALDTPERADDPLLQILRETQEAEPAFTQLAVFERVALFPGTPPIRLVVSLGYPLAFTERFEALYGTAAFIFPHVLATGEPVFHPNIERRPVRETGSAALFRLLAIRASAILPLLTGAMVGGTFDAASQAPYTYSAQSQELLRGLAGEIAIQLTAYQQVTRQGKWLAAIAEYVRTEQVGTLEMSSPQPGHSPRSSLSPFRPLARLGHAFLIATGAEEVYIQGLGLDLPTGSDALRIAAGQVGYAQPLVIRSSVDAYGALTCIALRVAIGPTDLVVGALWRALPTPRIPEREAALYELAGVCALAVSQATPTSNNSL
jgi:GAF domain-containing protein